MYTTKDNKSNFCKSTLKRFIRLGHNGRTCEFITTRRLLVKNVIIFTDLDGTLLDEKYSFQSALPALNLIRQYSVPLVLCSSKTRREIEFYRLKLGNRDPFVSENGGGIFVPKGYFGHYLLTSKSGLEQRAGYEVICLGAPYADLRRALTIVRGEGFTLRGFGDMSVDEVASSLGLSVEEATMAKEREFDEPFFFKGSEEEENKIADSIKTKGFTMTKGKIFHILGTSDKGQAVSILIRLYGKQRGTIITLGFGDSPNDKPLLEAVDVPIIVQKPSGDYDPRLEAVSNAIKARGIGPVGWNKAITELLPSLL